MEDKIISQEAYDELVGRVVLLIESLLLESSRALHQGNLEAARSMFFSVMEFSSVNERFNILLTDDVAKVYNDSWGEGAFFSVIRNLSDALMGDIPESPVGLH